MLNVLASSVVDRDFEPWSGKTKDYEIDICCFSFKLTVLRSTWIDWLARNYDNVSEWSDMLSCGMKIQLSIVGLVASEQYLMEM